MERVEFFGNATCCSVINGMKKAEKRYKTQSLNASEVYQIRSKITGY